MLPLFRIEADKRVQDPDPLNFKFFFLFLFFSSPASFLPSATVLGLVHSANLRFRTPQLLLILRGTLRFHEHMAKEVPVDVEYMEELRDDLHEKV